MLWWEVRLERLKGNQTVRSLKFRSPEIDPNCRGGHPEPGQEKKTMRVCLQDTSEAVV